jgi:ABC-type sugar transport system ATPase subunit
MDEPTAALSEREAEQLFEVIGRLRARRIGVIYITHRLKELSGIADRISVLRDGRRVVTAPAAELPLGTLVRHMVGETDVGSPPARPSCDGTEVLLEVRGLSRLEEFYDVSFSVRRGEIVGLAGLLGAGRTQVLESLFGMSRHDSGTIRVQGRVARIDTPAAAIRHGIALVPDDRKGKGLVPGASIRCNMVLASRRKFLIREDEELQASGRMFGSLRLRAEDVEAHVVTLSGGNQQKVVLAKWLLTGATIFLLDEPTRGIDVGAKAEIYALLRGLAADGAAVLFASSETDEVLTLADRVLVMHRGRISGELPRAEATEERIMHLATGGEAH